LQQCVLPGAQHCSFTGELVFVFTTGIRPDPGHDTVGPKDGFTETEGSKDGFTEKEGSTDGAGVGDGVGSGVGSGVGAGAQFPFLLCFPLLFFPPFGPLPLPFPL